MKWAYKKNGDGWKTMITSSPVDSEKGNKNGKWLKHM